MSEKVIASVQKLLASDKDVKVSIVRGAVYTRDNDGNGNNTQPVSIRYTQNGDPMAIGTLRCVNQIGERTSTYFVNFTAFGEIAESMANLKLDDKVVMITDRQRRRSKNGKWFDNDIVLYYERV